MKRVYTAGAIPRNMRRQRIGEGVLVFLWLVTAGAAAGDALPLLKDCSNPEEVLASVAETDRVQVHYGLGGNAQTCYAVTAAVNGKAVDGYMLGSSHPDVAAFEKDARSHVPVIPVVLPAAAPATAEAKAGKGPEPVSIKSFAGLTGMSPSGARVSLNNMKASTVVLYFWSANDKRSIHEAEGMEGVYMSFGKKGVGLVGVVSGGNAAQVRRVIKEQEVIWPQMVDTGAIAARFPETKQTRYYILDRERNVVAALKSASEVQRELLKRRTQTRGAE